MQSTTDLLQLLPCDPHPRTHNARERADRELQNAESRLLKLPAELRNRIYSECLPQGRTITTNKRKSRAKLEITLLGVSRAIRIEAAGIFYGNNRFQFLLHWRPPSEGQPEAEEFVAALSSDIVASLRSLEIVARRYCSKTCGSHGSLLRNRVRIDRNNELFPYDVTFYPRHSLGGGVHCECSPDVYRDLLDILKDMQLDDSQESLHKEELLDLMSAMKGKEQ